MVVDSFEFLYRVKWGWLVMKGRCSCTSKDDKNMDGTLASVIVLVRESGMDYRCNYNWRNTSFLLVAAGR